MTYNTPNDYLHTTNLKVGLRWVPGRVNVTAWNKTSSGTEELLCECTFGAEGLIVRDACVTDSGHVFILHHPIENPDDTRLMIIDCYRRSYVDTMTSLTAVEALIVIDEDQVLLATQSLQALVDTKGQTHLYSDGVHLWPMYTPELLSLKENTKVM